MTSDRRLTDRRIMPGRRMDVTRIEHENLCAQVDEMIRTLKRVETETREQGERLALLESAIRREKSNA